MANYFYVDQSKRLMIAQGEPEGLVVTYSSSVKMSEIRACGQDDSYFMLVLRPSLLLIHLAAHDLV